MREKLWAKTPNSQILKCLDRTLSQFLWVFRDFSGVKSSFWEFLSKLSEIIFLTRYFQLYLQNLFEKF
jgi:hypothetical protein